MRFKKGASRVFSVLTFLIFVFSLFVFVVVLSNWGKGVPSFFGYSFLSVSTASMEPNYPVGSIVITKKNDTSTLKIDDVISFYSDDPAIYGKPNTHRITYVDVNEVDQLYFVTKGDNNALADEYRVYEEKVIGKVEGSVSFLGKAIDLLKNRLVLFFILILPLICVVFAEVKHLKKILKSEDKDESNDSKTDDGLNESVKPIPQGDKEPAGDKSVPDNLKE